MALRKKNEKAETEKAKTEKAETEKAETEKAETEKAEKAVATVKTAGVPAFANPNALADLEDAIPNLEFGTLPIVKASVGELLLDDNSIGKRVTLDIVSFSSRWAVSPNDNDAPNELCKFSYDNEVLSDGSGMTVAEHLAELREMGYNKAASKRYVDLIGILREAEEETDEIGGMVSVSLSPSSVKAFTRYRLQVGVKLEDDPSLDPKQFRRVVATATKGRNGTNVYTYIAFKMAE